MNWYYARGNERMGPVDDGQFEQLIDSGVIGRETLVWREGLADWRPLGAISRATGVAGAAPEEGGLFPDSFARAQCAECGRGFPTDEMVAYEGAYVCIDCKPVFFQRIRERGGLGGQFHYGGFWIRFCARFLDGVILGVAGIPLSILQNSMLMGGSFFPSESEISGSDFLIIAVFWIISLLMGVTYETYFVGRFAATPGKMAFGLKVIMSDGGRVSYGRACGRYFGTMLSSFTLLIGYIIAAFDREKRALHDHICDTRVVYK